MAPQTEANNRVKSSGRAALNLLPSVLDAIQHFATELLERDPSKHNRAQCDVLNGLGTAAPMLKWKFDKLRAAGLDEKLIAHARNILYAVELHFPEEGFECAPCFVGTHEECHNLSHRFQTRSTDRPPSCALYFPEPNARNALLHQLKETFDELDTCFTDPSDSCIPTTNKPRTEPQWDISAFACKVFCALACRHDPGGCGFYQRSKTRLALATYSDITEEGEHFVDVLIQADAQTPPWVEVRIHKHTRPTVTFADINRQPASWRKKRPDKMSSFCHVLGRNERDVLIGRVNVAVDTEDAIWRHFPTHDRFLETNGNSRSISLATILASDTPGLNEMAKLVLAVTLGYALFYLFEGPWLMGQNGKALSRENIIFFENGGTVPIRPFLSPNVLGIDEDNVDGDSDHPYPDVLGFGILLLEIHLGRTLESFLSPGESMGSLRAKWFHAWKIFQDKKISISWPNYRNAIEACLNRNFGTDEEEEDDLNENDEQQVQRLRSVIFHTIVSGLLNDLEYSYGESGFIKLDDIDNHATGMDLGSGLSAAESAMGSPTTHDTHSPRSTNSQMLPSPEKSSLETETNLPCPISSQSDSTSFAPNSPKRTNTGELHTLFEAAETLLIAPETNKLPDRWIADFKKLRVFDRRGLHPVRVAILDTGIDMDHVYMRPADDDELERVRKVCDWTGESKGREDARTGDSLGHGTHIASIILDLAPNAQLYIARVTNTRELSGIQAENVANAIRTASTTWKCAIINISLGFPKDIKCIQDALEEASKANVLVFAAASNDGAGAGLAFPAWHPQVVHIFSRSSFDIRSEFNPSADDASSAGQAGFSIIGEYIDGAWPTNLSEGRNSDTRRLSGTSFATPVAVALAACVLGFARRVSEPPTLETSETRKLGSNDGMRRVLLKMSWKDKDGYLALDPFRFFDREEQSIVADIKSALNPRKW